MYAPRGVSFSDVGDIEVLPNGDDLHLFHLTLPNHDVVQHRVSTDGLSWQALPAALRTSDPGAVRRRSDLDDERHPARRPLLHALHRLGHRRRRTGAAHRPGNLRRPDPLDQVATAIPVAEADPRWYEATLAESGSVSWRDPKPIKVGDTYYAAVNAREATGPIMRRGCVGLFSSTDMEQWTVHPPLFAPRKYWDLECPQVFQIGDRFYLTASIMEDGTQRYWVASRFEGPYEVPADGGVLAPLGHYAGRICRWKGEDLYVCWHEPRPQNRGRIPLPPVDWATVRNPAGKFVVAPLELTPRPDGSLACRSFSGWATYRTAELAPPTPMATSLLHSAPSPANAWQIRNDAGGMDLLASDAPVGDVWFEGVLTFDAVAGGLAFRLDDDASGYFVTADRRLAGGHPTKVAAHPRSALGPPGLRHDPPATRRPAPAGPARKPKSHSACCRSGRTSSAA